MAVKTVEVVTTKGTKRFSGALILSYSLRSGLAGFSPATTEPM
jgi:hypothetical protein